MPLALGGQDVAGQAQTGTGKTAAFLIASFSLLLRKRRRAEEGSAALRCLIIAPTRELAVQIRDEAELLGRYCDFSIAAVYGGVDYEKQKKIIASGVDVLIGTPGRLIDFFKQKLFSLAKLEVLVIDEADRMFDMGFIDDIRFVLRRVPPPEKRVSFMYSATLSHRVMEVGYEHLNNPERISVSPDTIAADNIEQTVYHVGMEEKFPLLLGLLKREQPSRALLFVNTRLMASELADRLSVEGYMVGALAGDLDQRKRLRLLDDFKTNRVNIMVATDVASRGLHIDEVSHVFNYDLPQDPEDYVHRIGRTARAGASGKALSLACERYVYSLEAIEDFVGHGIPHSFPGADMMEKPKSSRPRRGRKKGGGRSGAGPSRPRGGRPDGEGGGRRRKRRNRVRDRGDNTAAEAV